MDTFMWGQGEVKQQTATASQKGYYYYYYYYYHYMTLDSIDPDLHNHKASNHVMVSGEKEED